MKLGKLLLFIVSLFLAFIFIARTYALASSSPDNWVTITSGSNHWFYGIAYGNNTFVIVGDYGTILTSADGVSWTRRTSGYTNHLYGVGFGNNTFVAVGSVGTILTSPDGVHWTLRRSDTAYNLLGVTYGNGIFVVVGGHRTILTSSDNGVTWDEPCYLNPFSCPIDDNWLYNTIYNGIDTFVAVGAYGTTTYSTDGGASWSPGTSGTTCHLMGVAYGNLTFVAVGQAGTILTSTNGLNWDPQPPPPAPPLTSEYLRGIVYDNGTFVAVGDSGTIIYSQDGTNWGSVTSETTPYDLEDVAYNNNINAFAAVGGYGTILLDCDSIPNLPVRILGVPPAPPPPEHYYSSIQVAYGFAEDGYTIQSQAWYFNEKLTFNRNITVAIVGGYDPMYLTNPIGTTINGTVTITDGTVVLEKIIIQ